MKGFGSTLRKLEICGSTRADVEEVVAAAAAAAAGTFSE
jgi:hypothetical protein